MSFIGEVSSSFFSPSFLSPNPLFYGLYHSLSFHCFILSMGQASEILTSFPALILSISHLHPQLFTDIYAI